MGKKKETVKIVLDTNILLSALLFKGELPKIVDLWKSGKIVPVISKETFEEFRVALEYPKFSLTKEEVKAIIHDDVLPYFEVIEASDIVKGACKGPDDDKFLSCALSTSVGIIVSGDKQFRALKKYGTVRIVAPSEFLKMFKVSFD
ncbi:MAG: putative toxin-antitoxin system toxin component, PIN family [Deltaproteobacteria bacterium]|nr:putative toxin-antitoxin system toxin component, PIN family [Deltaproteobacteria bacterium]